LRNGEPGTHIPTRAESLGVSDESETGDGAPDPEAEALRRQQLFVGSGIASIAGMAVVVVGLQQFPGVTPVVPFGAGMATTAVAFALLYVGLFGRS
jgi:hypothetical protein